ncbi:type III-B CRISPR-associated protein Cas10/Cmr2 [Umezakia ovalisporum]|uniref:type III-B CRISPR-associated protein Cas10/Cmr2 n=1 Tax=Umezakia ovalisporum TaxID=75695 RepID=UPI000AD33B8F|nr:type III-B CRISPR-associated protein Cas10/Cmr2 [Umezakia ovalisporum]MBI1240415.1 type III-B CRISPR-associated protein Cas10/Cmr2 [Nostoc sp. RI_552]MDH6087102.1 type III-B CRISPR-associated protein Cas10/Cmr2 [Umezakia ovalisporum Ak1311]
MKNSTWMTTAMAWCLAWGNEKTPQFDLAVLRQMQEALNQGQEVPGEVKELVRQVQELEGLLFPQKVEELKQLTEKFPQLWNSKIGLVYGGATKIKQYVFEASKLPDIRGASALLDRINLIDLPAFFGGENHPDYEQCQRAQDYCQEVRENWLNQPDNFPQLSEALIPELIIYSTGGNILAFCPPGFVDDLANAIEKRYTQETLTANSCAVGGKFKLLEIPFGLLPNTITKDTFWMEKCVAEWDKNPLIKAYFEQPNMSPKEAFQERKTFNELAGKLASLFNQRRNGNSLVGKNRPLRCYPPMFETHPYVVRDENDRRSAVIKAEQLPNEPWFSESLARKRLVGQIAKKDYSSTTWYEKAGFGWKPGKAIETWVNKFEFFLYHTPHKYYGKIPSEKIHPAQVKEAISVREIGDASIVPGFVAYIYADGNNMGGYIQKEIKNPKDYQNFSRDIVEATEKSVYAALTKHLAPHKLNPNLQAERNSDKEVWIHPFEILTIGGDDVMLIVPADKALAIAQTIGEEFEKILLSKGKRYRTDGKYNPKAVHRYQVEKEVSGENKCEFPCKLSMSTGVLITADDTPIYYAERLTGQLLKSAKKQAKELKKKDYYGGTVDFLVMKSVTMISSNINDFRSEGLTKFSSKRQKLKLYAAPYTLYELGGLLKTAEALKNSEFPRSQLYQIRSLLEQGKQTAILNYRYLRVRLSDKKAQDLLKIEFEDAWCQPKDPSNNGNLAPWMSLKEGDKVTYETIWRELVDLYPFITKQQDDSALTTSQPQTLQS